MTDRKEVPDLNFLNHLFTYDSESGELTRNITTSSNAKKGDIIKCLCKKGYKRVRIENKYYYAHRLIWKMYYKENPPKYLDHINQDKSDNRIKNIRISDASKNGFNRKIQSNNTTGICGVTRSRDKWLSSIRIKNRKVYLGIYKEKNDAIKARKNAENYYYMS